MIRDYTDRCPGSSAGIIFLLFAVLPALLLIPTQILFPGPFSDLAVRFISIYAFVLQLLLLLHVERPILVMQPFLMGLAGLILSEILYTVSESAYETGMGPSGLMYLISSALVIIFGSELGSILAALPAYWLILAVRKLAAWIRYH